MKRTKKSNRQLTLNTPNPFYVGVHVRETKSGKYLGQVVKIDRNPQSDWHFAQLDDGSWLMSDDVDNGLLTLTARTGAAAAADAPLFVKSPFLIGQRLFFHAPNRTFNGYGGVVCRVYPAHISKGVWFALTKLNQNASSDELLTRDVTVGKRPHTVCSP